MKNKKAFIGIAFTLLLIVGMATLALLRKSSQEETTLEETREEPASHKITIEDLVRESEGFDKAERELKQFEAANPFVQNLPYQSESFEIYYKAVNGPTGTEIIYKVILYPQMEPSDSGAYKEEIDQLMGIVQKWVKSKGFNPDTLPVEWSIAPDFYE